MENEGTIVFVTCHSSPQSEVSPYVSFPRPPYGVPLDPHETNVLLGPG